MPYLLEYKEKVEQLIENSYNLDTIQDDQQFIDFLRYLLKIDPNERPTAEEALNHPWFKVQY